MVQDVRQAERALGQVSYGCTRQEEANVIFRKSVFAVQDIPKGGLLTEENVRVIRPGYGLSPRYFREVLGQAALQEIKKGTPIQFDLIGKTGPDTIGGKGHGFDLIGKTGPDTIGGKGHG